MTLMLNQKAYDALSPENKAILEAASTLAHVDVQAKYDAFNPGALKQLAAQKTKVLPFPKEMMDVAFKHAQDVYGELNEKNANWKKVFADYSKFRADQNWWFRFGEARFDSFMQAQKL